MTVRRLAVGTELEFLSLQTSIWQLTEALRRTRTDANPAPIVPPREWRESIGVPPGRADRFWVDFASLNAHRLKDSRAIALDGMQTQVVHLDELAGIGGFRATPDSTPRTRVVNLVLDLAAEVLRDERSEWWLEAIDGYRRNGLHVKQFAGSPRISRLFASVTSDAEAALRDLFAGIPDDDPTIVDLRNCEGMGAIVYPLFAEFEKTHRYVAWVPSERAYDHLRAAEVHERRMSPTLAEARGQLALMQP